MEKGEQVHVIEESGIIAIIRFEHCENLCQAARAIRAGGIRVIEFSVSVPGALGAVEQAVQEFGDESLIGAGTVLDPETARAALRAGAQFIVAPTLNREVIDLCHESGRAVIPGALTPTEIQSAWEWGADFAKVFPADFGGPAYLKAIRAPLPKIRLVPVGGVTLENSASFIRAGAAALGVGSSMVKQEFVMAKRFADLTSLAALFVEAVEKAREPSSSSDYNPHAPRDCVNWLTPAPRNSI